MRMLKEERPREAHATLSLAGSLGESDDNESQKRIMKVECYENGIIEHGQDDEGEERGGGMSLSVWAAREVQYPFPRIGSSQKNNSGREQRQLQFTSINASILTAVSFRWIPRWYRRGRGMEVWNVKPTQRQVRHTTSRRPSDF